MVDENAVREEETPEIVGYSQELWAGTPGNIREEMEILRSVIAASHLKAIESVYHGGNPPFWQTIQDKDQIIEFLRALLGVKTRTNTIDPSKILEKNRKWFIKNVTIVFGPHNFSRLCDIYRPRRKLLPKCLVNLCPEREFDRPLLRLINPIRKRADTLPGSVLMMLSEEFQLKMILRHIVDCRRNKCAFKLCQDKWESAQYLRKQLGLSCDDCSPDELLEVRDCAVERILPPDLSGRALTLKTIRRVMSLLNIPRFVVCGEIPARNHLMETVRTRDIWEFSIKMYERVEATLKLFITMFPKEDMDSLTDDLFIDVNHYLKMKELHIYLCSKDDQMYEKLISRTCWNIEIKMKLERTDRMWMYGCNCFSFYNIH